VKKWGILGGFGGKSCELGLMQGFSLIRGAQAIQAELFIFLTTVGRILPVDANSMMFSIIRNHLDKIVLRDPSVFFT
jgi:hypothetical protein